MGDQLGEPIGSSDSL